METTKAYAVETAKEIIGEHIDRVRAMNLSDKEAESDTKLKSASTCITYEPQTEEAYTTYLKNEIGVLLEMVLLLTGLLPYWKRIDVLADKKTTIPGIEKHPPRAIKIDIRLFAK